MEIFVETVMLKITIFICVCVWEGGGEGGRIVVVEGHFNPRYCQVSVELGRGKSVICITVE